MLDEAIGQELQDLLSQPFQLLLGRRTYEIFAAYWPRVPVDSGSRAIADLFNSVPKHVATHRSDTLDWQNSHSLEGDLADAVRRGAHPSVRKLRRWAACRPMNLQFWFEFGSTYSYPAAMRIEALAARHGLTIAWRAFLLGPIFREQGWNDSPFNLYPTKGRYMWRDLERICQAQEVPFRRPSQFPRNGLLAARVASTFSNAPWLPDFVRAVYRANFAEDLDISSPEVVARCLDSSGEAPAALLEEAQSPESKARLQAQTDEAVRLGIFGAPSFLVSGELFWGNDRLADALSWAVEHAA